MVSDDAARARLPRRFLFTLDLKVLGKMEAGRAFQNLAVRIRNEDAKRFVCVHGISTTDSCGTSRFDDKKMKEI
ncbi:jg10807 [Pararge aegeria aegeria]|uniref:Jg10807 protein n=1 Tax=Pararge aegeria aegeria TaxID=348720 RepID=A0A8S4RAC8_9NEOP|nr:jg10807 [Pararge aegeria aegeria]